MLRSYLGLSRACLSLIGSRNLFAVACVQICHYLDWVIENLVWVRCAVHLLQVSYSFRFYAEYFCWVAGDSSGPKRLLTLKLNLQVKEFMSDLTLGKLLQESYQRFKLSLRKYSLEDHKNYAFCCDTMKIFFLVQCQK